MKRAEYLKGQIALDSRYAGCYQANHKRLQEPLRYVYFLDSDGKVTCYAVEPE